MAKRTQKKLTTIITRLSFIFIVIITAQGIHAALAPQHQNDKDLNVMISFIKQHDKVLSTLESIDFGRFTIYFNNGCKAIFTRAVTDKPPGWAGPADPLVFKSADCEIK